LVERAGQVVGVDRSAAALSRARTRAEEQSLVNVTFRESELSAIAFDQRFDAAIGRYVLCFQTFYRGAGAGVIETVPHSDGLAVPRHVLRRLMKNGIPRIPSVVGRKRA
jgi:hypothetical protein